MAQAKSHGPKVLHQLKSALTKEWREQNVLGAYAAASIVGTNTKPEHGLLVVPHAETQNPQVLLAGLDETLYIGDRAYPISTHVFSDKVFPEGYLQLENFYYTPFPSWIFRVEGLAFLKMVMLLHEENTVLIRYQLLSSYGDFVRLQVRPITAFRSATSLCQNEEEKVPSITTEPNSLLLEPSNGFPSIQLFHNAGVIDREGVWMKGIAYGAGGLSSAVSEENLYSPCSFLYAFLKEDGVYLCVSAEKKREVDPFLLELQEKRRRNTDPSH